MAARLVKVFHVRLALPQGTVNTPHPLGALNRNPGPPRVVGAPNGEAKVQPPAPLPPRKENTDDSSVAVVRDDKSAVEKLAVENRGREQHVQPVVLDDPPKKRRKRHSEEDERLSVRDIAVTLAAVIVVSFGFTAFLPSMLTRDAVETTVVATVPPQQPAQVDRIGAALSAGAPAPAQPAAAPVSNPPAAVANTAPALRTGIVPQGKQASGRATAAIDTGLKGAAKTAAVAVAAPRRPAPTRPALTADEKAAIERGLKALQQEAEQAKP